MDRLVSLRGSRSGIRGVGRRLAGRAAGSDLEQPNGCNAGTEVPGQQDRCETDLGAHPTAGRECGTEAGIASEVPGATEGRPWRTGRPECARQGKVGEEATPAKHAPKGQKEIG